MFEMNRYLITILLSSVIHVAFSQNSAISDSHVLCSQAISLNGNDWRLATDSANIGIRDEWFKTPPISDSRQTPVPWVIQDIFHNYHGVAWYWRKFLGPEKQDNEGKVMLKFHAVDYLAEVWLNGKKIGNHEGGEFSFELDVTDSIKYDENNLLVVRVLNPTYEPIDNISLIETPSSLKHYPFTSNAVYNSGGITGDVELLMVPNIRVTDLFVLPNWETGNVKIKATILNSQNTAISSSSLSFEISEARSGIPIILKNSSPRLTTGTNIVEMDIAVPDHRLWSPEDPFLYRISTSIKTAQCLEKKSVRFGFRDFRFENGYYRLNGKRIFLRGSNSSTHYPISYSVPLNGDMLRRDVINMKALGQNFVRIPFGCPNPEIFDIYDELGILVHQEHYGSWQMGEYGGFKFPRPENINDSLLSRFEMSISGVIKRDRNHPSIVIWGALNENKGDMVFRKAVELLPKLRELDPTRLIVLNSGRFDGVNEIGSMSSPGSITWDISESKLKDWHPYVWIPYSKETLDLLSGRAQKNYEQSIYISESGLCFPIDLPSELGDYQQRGKENSDDARYFKRQYDKFLADWNRFELDDLWPRPEDYIRDAYKTANSLRITGETAIRSNPSLVAYTPTNGVADYSMGESVATNFRRLKPELIPSVLLANSPLRWCLSTEPQSIYGGNKIQMNASFSNLDVLSAGKYPATVQVVDSDMKVVYIEKVSVLIPETNDENHEPPFAQSIWTDEIEINGKSGKYSFLATLDQGGTAIGGKTEFYVTDSEDPPNLPHEIVLFGKDSIVSNWLNKQNIKVSPLNTGNKSARQVIVIVGKKAQESNIMLNVARNMARGSVVIFLTPSTLRKGENPTGWIPLINKGTIEPMDHVAGYYRADRWVKKHPIFAGMPSGGMMDYKYFRNVISLNALSQEYTIRAQPAHTFAEASTPLTYPTETVCGATRISHTYSSGIQLGIWNFGNGQFIVNTLNIAENLGRDPAADRIFSNMLRFASKDIFKPLVGIPENFNQQLKEIGYQK